MAKRMRNAARGLALAGVSTVAIGCGSGETPPPPTIETSATLTATQAPTSSVYPAHKDIYPGAGILSLEDGKTYMDGCFTLSDPDGRSVVGVVKNALWTNNRLVPLISTVGEQSVPWPIGVQQLTADKLYHPPDGLDVYQPPGSDAKIHCKTELVGMRFRDYAIGHLALVQRDSDNNPLYGQAPFNETTQAVQEGPDSGLVQTKLPPNGQLVIVHQVNGPR